MSAMRRGMLVAAIAAVVAGSAIGADAAFSVSGSIIDGAGVAVPGIRVRVFDDDVGADTLLQTTYSDPTGAFRADVTTTDFGVGESLPDVYVLVDWYFQLLPANTFNGHHLYLVEREATMNPFDAVTRCLHNDHDPAGNIGCGQVQMIDSLDPNAASIANLTRLINQGFNYYADRKGTVPWSVDYDVPIYIETRTAIGTSGTGSYFLPAYDVFPASIHLVDRDIDGATVGGVRGYQSDIYHEVSHMVHWYLNGMSFSPDGVVNRAHNINSEKSPRFAFKEGWADYVSDRTDALPGHSMDMKLAAPIQDQLFTNWRGGSALDVDGTAESRMGATGRENGTFENGEEVEGAISGFFYDVHRDPLFGSTQNFQMLFAALVAETPDDMLEMMNRLATTSGNGTAATRKLFEHGQRHGLFWTRARFPLSPFDESAPPNDADLATPGNRKDIRGYVFLRGVVSTRIEASPAVTLGVAATIAGSKARIGYAPAQNGLGMPVSTFTSFTPQVNFSGPFATVDMDTRTFTPSGGDGDWDLLALSENTFGFEDDFRPSWSGDAKPIVDSDEKYLKTQGAWFDKDRDHATFTVEQGKVVVDNTAPIVDPASLKPQ
ncbi:MAG TPA: carboxypeptidase-like regulatory domain-containing protein [Candidatus Binatia bacterium]|nr:carboxypeptidase-like regulatory domain-containing protein [Candidatus Binatia bacterium]